MTNRQCFKSVAGTEYNEEVKKHYEDREKWRTVINQVGEMLNEQITRMALAPKDLYLDLEEVKNEELLKLFTKNGKLKTTTKEAREYKKSYTKIVKENDLEDYQEMGLTNFKYGIMRFAGETMESFVAVDGITYFKTNFNLADRAKGVVEPVSEIEYEETYLAELKASKGE